MARPRVFVSSTYYDLKHLRSSLENFVESLGFDAILSEKGQIAYTPDVPLDESCYREVGNADIFVLIVGGRYGSEVSAGKKSLPKTFYERYNSITRGEYRSAVDRDVPIYVLVERSVHAEYETFLRNKDNQKIVYAHVDSVNVFELIESIIGQARNNPIQQFDKYSEIELWLREQWAGLFRELLQRTQGHAQLASLQGQVAQLAELNTTFKRYLEEIVSRIAPQKSKTLIRTETKRLKDATLERVVRSNPLGKHLIEFVHIPIEVVSRAVINATTLDKFYSILATEEDDTRTRREISQLAERDTGQMVLSDLNDMRLLLGIAPIKPKRSNLVPDESEVATDKKQPESTRPKRSRGTKASKTSAKNPRTRRREDEKS